MDEYFPLVKGIDISKLKINKEGEYSVTKPNISQFIMQYLFKKIKDCNLTVLDGTGNVGGDTIGFGLNNKVKKVYSIEINKDNFNILKNNVSVYKLNNKVNMINKDFTEYIKQIPESFCDLIFIDPPWGGPRYKYLDKLNLYLSNINIGLVCKDIKYKKLTKHLAIKIPFNFNITSFQNLSGIEDVSIYNVPNTSVYLVYANLE